MNKTKNHLAFLLILLFQIPLFAYQIVGTLTLTDDWAPKIYLSAIPSFDDQRTASEDLIVQMAGIEEAWFESAGYRRTVFQ